MRSLLVRCSEATHHVYGLLVHGLSNRLLDVHKVDQLEQRLPLLLLGVRLVVRPKLEDDRTHRELLREELRPLRLGHIYSTPHELPRAHAIRKQARNGARTKLSQSTLRMRPSPTLGKCPRARTPQATHLAAAPARPFSCPALPSPRRPLSQPRHPAVTSPSHHRAVRPKPKVRKTISPGPTTTPPSRPPHGRSAPSPTAPSPPPLATGTTRRTRRATLSRYGERAACFRAAPSHLYGGGLFFLLFPQAQRILCILCMYSLL